MMVYFIVKTIQFFTTSSLHLRKKQSKERRQGRDNIQSIKPNEFFKESTRKTNCGALQNFMTPRGRSSSFLKGAQLGRCQLFMSFLTSRVGSFVNTSPKLWDDDGEQKSEVPLRARATSSKNCRKIKKSHLVINVS